MFVLVVTWSEPESGVEVFGPYTTKSAAEKAIPKVKPQFINEDVDPDEPPEDVEFHVKKATKPR